MALVTEDGTGLANAEAYASVAQADARMAATGMTNWATLTPDEKEQALRRATNYMTQTYRGRWKGARMTGTQALDWPRSGVWVDGFEVADDTVPLDVVNASIDLALKAAAGDLSADVTGRIVIREKVGPLETEYAPGETGVTAYRAIDNTLAVYLTNGGASGMFSVIRA